MLQIESDQPSVVRDEKRTNIFKQLGYVRDRDSGGRGDGGGGGEGGGGRGKEEDEEVDCFGVIEGRKESIQTAKRIEVSVEVV